MSTTEHNDPSPRGLTARWASAIGGLEPWQRRALLVVLAVALGMLLLVAIVSVAFGFMYLSAPVPAPDELDGFTPSIVVDREAEPIETLKPAELRRDVRLDDLPEHVVQAVLAAEDRRFYDHSGFSLRDITRAAWTNLTTGGARQGASTITQQYVDIAVADIGDGYVSKLREAAIAARIDDKLAKDEILDAYLDQVPFGRDAVGIEAGARMHFGVAAADLELEQAATLAGMIAAPSAFDPVHDPEAAAERRDFVLHGMRQMGVLDDTQVRDHLGTQLPELRTEPLRTFGPAAYYLEIVREQVPELLDDPGGDIAEGLVVHTALDQRAQSLMAEQLAAHLSEASYTGAAVTIESETGAVRALAGGLDAGEQQFNVATEGERQAGSAFKPFALVEFVTRGYDPDATRVDAPEEYDVPSEAGEDATVGNYSGDGHGEVSVREATTESINTAYVRLAEELGAARIAATARDMGISSELHEFPSLVLGTAGVRPFDMTVAYATLSASGTRQRPYLVERIEDADGEVLYEHEPSPEEVLDPEVAHVVTDVLVDVVESGTGLAADLPRPNAGKTGTTNDYRDAWFVGYTPRHATAVWTGNLDNTPMAGDITGGSLPARIWGAYMSAFVEPFDVEEFPGADTSGLRPLTGLEAPDEPDGDADDDDQGPENDDDEDQDEGDEGDEGDDEANDGGGDGGNESEETDDGRGPNGDGPPGQDGQG